MHTKWTQNYSKSKLGTLIIEIYITVPPPKVARPNDPTVNPTEVTSNQGGKLPRCPHSCWLDPRRGSARVQLPEAEMPLTAQMYPGNQLSCGKAPLFIGKSSANGPCSKAMLYYQRILWLQLLLSSQYMPLGLSNSRQSADLDSNLVILRSSSWQKLPQKIWYRPWPLTCASLKWINMSTVSFHPQQRHQKQGAMCINIYIYTYVIS